MFRKKVLSVLLLLVLLCQINNTFANNVKVETKTMVVDGSIVPYNKLLPGDTIYLNSGTRDYLLIRNFLGTPSKPLIFINIGGIVSIDTDHFYGISIQNCRYFKITGSGVQNSFYGIEIKRVANGTGIGIGMSSSDFEIDHVSIKDVPIAGIYAKTDPDCSNSNSREKFTQFNTILHDNYIENAGNEGMYIGSTKYFGQSVNCNGKDTLMLPSLLDGVKIYNNIIKYAGWDGIQVSSAYKNCQVFDNLILHDSQAEYPSQMSGIILGGGSNCDCYNNYISDGKGDGIEYHGLGGNRIFNNIIINAGVDYAPGDYTKMKYGIFVSDISTLPNSTLHIQNNTIVRPKSDGIRFTSSKSKNNLISSNVIIGPGNFEMYEYGNTQFKGIDSYIMVTDKSISIQKKNNYFARNTDASGMDFDYSLLKKSPLIDAGYAEQPFIGFDFKHHPRNSGNPPDIGAFEYYSLLDPSEPTKEQPLPVAYPNPVKNELIIKFIVNQNSDVTLSIYNLQGKQLEVKEQSGLATGTYTTKVDVEHFAPGIYLYSIKSLDHLVSGKFLKMN